MVSTPGFVEDTVGGAAYVVRVAGYTVPADAVGPVLIRRGRARPDLRPDPAACSFTLATERLAQLPLTGDQVEVDLSPEALTFLGLTVASPALERFRGRITDLRARSTGRVTGPARLEVIATGPRSRAVRVDVGGAGYPVELDGARAVRILTEAAVLDPGLELGTSDAGTDTVLAYIGEPTAAGTLLDRLSVSTGGELVETRAGLLEWHDHDHRRDLDPALTLHPGEVLNESAEAAQGVGGLLNDVTLTWGSTPEEVRVVDEVSADPVTGYGPMAQRLESDLTSAVDAESRAFELVGRYGRPRWRFERLAVDLLRTVTPATAVDLLELEFGAMLAVEGFPTTGPFTSGRFFVEGGAETLTRDAWRLSVAVSEYELTGGSVRWVDFGGSTVRYIVGKWRRDRIVVGSVYVAGGPTWAELATTDPDRTWFGAVGWDVESGQTDRWVDQPSDRAWDEVDPADTWTTFTGL